MTAFFAVALSLTVWTLGGFVITLFVAE